MSEEVKPTEMITIESNELKDIEISKAAQIKAVFDPMAEMLLEFEDKYNEVVAESSKEITKDITEKARRLRLDIKKVRVQTEKTRKDQKSEYLKAGRAIDGVANILIYAVSDKEKELQKIEDHFELIEKERLEKLQSDRVEMLLPYSEDAANYDLSGMKDDVWEAFIDTKKRQHDERIAAEKKAEEERIENERLDKLENERRLKALEYRQFWDDENFPFRTMSDDQFNVIIDNLKKAEILFIEEQERIRLENERLKKEAEEKRKKEEAERKKREAEAAEKERKHQEALRKEREEREHAQKLAKEKEEKLQAELKAKEEAEEKRVADEQARIKAEEEAEEKRVQDELNKGDSDKIKDLISDLEALKIKYVFKSKKNIKMYSDVSTLIDKVVSHIRKG